MYVYILYLLYPCTHFLCILCLYRLRVGFITYDKKIHFHALSNGALHVISEVKDPFVSLPDSEILIDLMDDEKFNEWQRLLMRVPKLFEQNALIPESENKSCFGALYMQQHKY